jgi:hypothetical protein
MLVRYCVIYHDINMAVLCVVVAPKSLVKFAYNTEVLFTLMMGTAGISETKANFYRNTQCSNPNGNFFHTRRREKLNFHMS